MKKRTCKRKKYHKKKTLRHRRQSAGLFFSCRKNKCNEEPVYNKSWRCRSFCKKPKTLDSLDFRYFNDYEEEDPKEIKSMF